MVEVTALVFTIQLGFNEYFLYSHGQLKCVVTYTKLLYHNTILIGAFVLPFRGLVSCCRLSWFPAYRGWDFVFFLIRMYLSFFFMCTPGMYINFFNRLHWIYVFLTCSSDCVQVFVRVYAVYCVANACICLRSFSPVSIHWIACFGFLLFLVIVMHFILYQRILSRSALEIFFECLFVRPSSGIFFVWTSLYRIVFSWHIHKHGLY